MRAAVPPPRAVAAAAVDFVIEAYEGVAVRPGKGLPHAQAVADILRNAGADERTQVAALLHDVVEDTPRDVDDVREAFGDDVAAMVEALTEDKRIERYAQRKRARTQIAIASEPAVVDLALADKIASLRHAAITGTAISRRKLSHYRATLRLALAEDPTPPLTAELARLLSVSAVAGRAGGGPRRFGRPARVP